MIRILLIALALVACGHSARLKSIRATYDATNIAAEHLTAYSASHEAEIVAGAESLAGGQVQLAAWRSRVDKAEKLLAGLYRAVATAALVNDDRSIATLLQAAGIVRAELAALGVTP